MIYKLFGSIFIVLFTLASLVPDAPQDIPNTDTHTELQEIYAQNLALSPDMVLPNGFGTNNSILEEIYAQNLALSPNMFLPADYISDTAILEEIYASGLAVSNNLTISR